MAWLGTVMTVSGWVAVVAGALSFLFNDLLYMRNLHEAAAAPTSREFLGNVHQMKENATDGAMGLMAIVAGRAGIKMGPGFNMQSVLAPFKKGGGVYKTLKGGLGKVKKGVVGGGQKMLAGFQKLASGGLKEITKLKNRIKSLFKKKKTDQTPEEINKNKVAEDKLLDGDNKKVVEDGPLSDDIKKQQADNDDGLNGQKNKENEPSLSDKVDNVTPDDIKGICFPGNTIVKTVKGDISIENIVEGDLVWSYNFKTQCNELQMATRLYESQTTRLVRIELEGDVLLSTWTHPFWVESMNRWVEASALRAGMVMRTMNDIEVKVIDTSLIMSDTRVYNLEVVDNHNYFVGEKGILVHNKNTSFLRELGAVPSEIYGIMDMKTGELIYVGKATGTSTMYTRFAKHIQEAGKKWNMDISKNVLHKGSPRFKPVSLAKGNWNKLTTALLEQNYINMYKKLNKIPLLNKIRAIAPDKLKLIQNILSKKGMKISELLRNFTGKCPPL